MSFIFSTFFLVKSWPTNQYPLKPKECQESKCTFLCLRSIVHADQINQPGFKLVKSLN